MNPQDLAKQKTLANEQCDSLRKQLEDLRDHRTVVKEQGVLLKEQGEAVDGLQVHPCKWDGPSCKLGNVAMLFPSVSLCCFHP